MINSKHEISTILEDTDPKFKINKVIIDVLRK